MRLTHSSRRAGGARLAVLLLTCVTAVAAGPAPARADVITDWNLMTFQVGGPAIQRTLAMVHIAMFDAVNSIARRYAPYQSLIDVPADTSAVAAAAAAAHGILVRRFPEQQAALDAALAASIAGIPAGPARTAGLALGDEVAAALHAARSTDNMLAPNPAYTPGTGPGLYQLTPPGFAAPVNVAAGTWVPFALLSAGQFRANGPLPLTHPRYAGELEEVRTFGDVGSSARAPDQTLSALWHIEQSVPAFNRIARAESAAQGFDLLTAARLFALLNIALADGVTSVFETKYVYNYWRPVTAIRGAAGDGNPHTSADSTWTPLLNTPPHPEYPSAHSVTQFAATQVMEAFFGQHYAFSTTSSAVPGTVRTFASFRDYAIDGSLARIYGGIHFRSALEDGARQGRQVGNWILESMLRPVRHD